MHGSKKTKLFDITSQAKIKPIFVLRQETSDCKQHVFFAMSSIIARQQSIRRWAAQATLFAVLQHPSARHFQPDLEGHIRKGD